MPITELVTGATRIRCTTHVGPDADGLGCCFAFREGMHQLGKPCEVLLDGGAPSQYPFVANDFDPSAELATGDVLFVFDVTDRGRLGERLSTTRSDDVVVVNVDHHLSNTRFGHLNLIDVEASSSCEVALALLRELRVQITPRMADVLLYGLIFDTQGFHTSSTNSRSLRAAADLVDAGAHLGNLIQMSFRSHSVAKLRLLGALAARGVHEGPLFWTVADETLLAEFGATADDADGAANFLSTLGEVEVIVVFKCFEPDSIKVSVRSSDRINASELCAEFGGGGHRRASGCSISGKRAEAMDAFLTTVRRQLGLAQTASVG